jgi:hypothetical protein
VAHRWYYAELLTLCLSPAAPVHRASVGYSAASLRGQMSAVGRVGTVVGISVQIGDYPMERLAGRVDTLHEWLLVRLP